MVESLYLKSTKKSLSTENLFVNRKIQLMKKAQEIAKEKGNLDKNLEITQSHVENKTNASNEVKGFLKDLLLSSTIKIFFCNFISSLQ